MASLVIKSYPELNIKPFYLNYNHTNEDLGLWNRIEYKVSNGMTNLGYFSKGRSASFYGLILDTVSLIPALNDYKILPLAVN